MLPQRVLRGRCDPVSKVNAGRGREDWSMLTRIALPGLSLAALPIASAQAQDRDGAKVIGAGDGISCTCYYSLQPGAAIEPGKWWKTPLRCT